MSTAQMFGFPAFGFSAPRSSLSSPTPTCHLPPTHPCKPSFSSCLPKPWPSSGQQVEKKTKNSEETKSDAWYWWKRKEDLCLVISWMLYFKQIILRFILIALFNSVMLTVIVDKLKNIKGGFEWWFTVECLQMGLEPVYSRSKINL